MDQTLATRPPSSRFTHLLGMIAVVLVTSTASAQTTNLALAGTATQSTNYSSTAGLAINAIDGNTSGVWSQGSVTHTDNQANSWWRVDLGGVYTLETLRMYNRSDCCGLRLSNFWVTVQSGTTEVFNQDYFIGTGSVAQGGMFEIQLPLGTSGDIVAIGIHGLNNDGNGYLSLAEFEVMGGAVGTNYCIGAPNSVGAGAHMVAGGSDSVSANDLVLYSGLVPDQYGVFFYGSTQVQVPFGHGYLCIAGQVSILYPPVLAVSNQATLAIDNTSMPATGQITVGSTWNFQHYYRDPAMGAPAFNASDGISLTFTP